MDNITDINFNYKYLEEQLQACVNKICKHRNAIEFGKANYDRLQSLSDVVDGETELGRVYWLRAELRKLMEKEFSERDIYVEKAINMIASIKKILNVRAKLLLARYQTCSIEQRTADIEELTQNKQGLDNLNDSLEMIKQISCEHQRSYFGIEEVKKDKEDK